MKRRICVVGYGNVGREAIECIRQAEDMEFAGLVRRTPVNPGLDAPVVSDVSELGKVDAAILTVPSREVPKIAPLYLQKGINTVDSFDVHGAPVLELRRRLDADAKKAGSVAIIGAGWDPGTDSLVRMIFAALAPRGITYTNYGPGMSMGHTVAVKAIPGVKDAISMTLPAGFGRHKRGVYVEIREGADFQDIVRRIKTDPYFINDETQVTQVDSVQSIEAMSHGVHMERYGSSGSAQNQILELRMRLTNPSATSQVMVSAARASTRIPPGAYCLGEVAPVDLLPGNREANLRALV